ncbi:MAG TPA: chemotaxis protein CheA [Geobacteraceae bacterium]|nr:chemotaxis protein CheA [Geobacteraceae bacterium]
MDMSKYRELFLSESREHLSALNKLIVDLEGDGGDRENINALFRSAHSIKGMAASMGYGEIAGLAHKIEDLMDKVRKELLVFDRGIADLLLEGSDLLEGLLNDAEAGGAARDLGDFLERLINYPPAERPAAPSPPPAAETGAPQEERRAGERRTGDRRVGDRRQEQPDPRQSIRVRTNVLDNLINTTGELITNKHRLLNVGKAINSPQLGTALEELSRLLRELHNEVLNVRMMPFSSITERFPRLVRDLAKKSGKDVAFEIEGQEIELDRGVLEELADPLVHILRNAVDHGLETEADRLACGKGGQGKVKLSATREKDRVIVIVEDDGRGMDPAKLIKAALAKGIITPEAAKLLTPRDAFLLTCRPGFSTSREVTDVSGRGVGMDVAHSKLRALGGSLAIDSDVGRGTRITLAFPLTIAIINVLLVGCADRTFAVPVTGIHRTLEIRRDAISVRGKHKVFYLGEEPIPLLSMNRILGLPAAPPRDAIIPLVIGEVRGHKVALAVDHFLGHQEIFVKPLGRPLGRMKGLAGGAIIGNGEVVFILDIANLL